jgi:hypothetical protein
VPAVKRIDQWHRLHRLQPPVTLRVVTSPISGDWLVRVDGWEFPYTFPLLYDSLEAAQRAADDVLINYRPAGGLWGVGAGRGAGQTIPERPM